MYVYIPAMLKLSKLPVVNPMTRHKPMKPPAASRSPSATQSPEAIIQLDPNQPLVKPYSSCTTIR